MFKIINLVFFAVVSSRFVAGQIEYLIGLPAEYSEKYNDWKSDLNNDIWSEDDQLTLKDDSSPQKLFETLCDKYDLELNHELIDCENIKIVSKSLKLSGHNVKKREAPEEILEEGSGDDSPVDLTTVKTDNDGSIIKPQLLRIAPVPEVSNTTKKSISPEIVNPPKEQQPVEEVVTQAESKSPEEQTHVEEPAVQTEINTAKESNISVEPKEAESKPKESPVEPEAATSKDQLETLKETNQSESTDAKEIQITTTESAVIVTEKAQETNKDSSGTSVNAVETDKPKLVEPSQNLDVNQETVTENKPAEIPNSDKVKLNEGKEQAVEIKNDETSANKEEVNQQQDGNAILKDAGSISETDKKLRTMKHNESIKSTSSNGEEPKSGASESDEKGKKDNKLLITLFVTVLALGAAAFAYNFIKKRKNRAAAAAAGSPTQNNGTPRNDVEEGREMKPLMTSPQQSNSVEYKDEK